MMKTIGSIADDVVDDGDDDKDSDGDDNSDKEPYNMMKTFGKDR